MSDRRRANARPRRRFPRSRAVASGAGALALLLSIAVIVALDDPDEPSLACTPVESFQHVHGLAVAPGNEPLLYVATHFGLIRGTNDTGWCKVGASEDDYMGFTMHPTNGSVFWASGHPASGGNMGVRQSIDGGFTWRFLGLRGVDFHAMTVSPAEPDRLWGSFQGDVYRSETGGVDWAIVSGAPPGTTTLAGHPADVDTVLAGGAGGTFRSDDGGVNWIRSSDMRTLSVAIRPAHPQNMAAVTMEGTVVLSSDGGGTWSGPVLEAQGLGQIAYGRADPDLLYAATGNGQVFKSVEGAQTWHQVL